jgi:hypothetical protein
VIARGDMVAYKTAMGVRHLVVLSIDSLTAAGTAIVVEADDRDPISGLQSLLTVPLMPGWHAKAWRMNYMSAERLTTGGEVIATISAEQLARIVAAVNAAIEP